MATAALRGHRCPAQPFGAPLARYGVGPDLKVGVLGIGGLGHLGGGRERPQVGDVQVDRDHPFDAVGDTGDPGSNQREPRPEPRGEAAFQKAPTNCQLRFGENGGVDAPPWNIRLWIS